MTSKLYSLPKLLRLVGKLKRRKKRIVFTNGCFDILHAGHIEYLERSKKFGHFLVVGLNSDSSVRRLKGRARPINEEQDRARVLSGLQAVDGIVIFDQETPLRLITAIRPDVLVKGSDWSESQIVGSLVVSSWGGAVRRIPLLKGRSTSATIKKIYSQT